MPARDGRQDTGLEPRLDIGRVAPVGADHHGRPPRPAIKPAVQFDRLHQNVAPDCFQASTISDPVANPTPPSPAIKPSPPWSPPIRCGTPIRYGCRQIAMTRPERAPSA